MEGTLGRVLRTCVAASALTLVACSATRGGPPAVPGRAFAFPADTFAFTNDSHWMYVDGVWTQLAPPPAFALHCAGMARAARQFHVYARFDPSNPPVDEAAYRARVLAVLARDPRVKTPVADPVVIPGYADLLNFSAAHEALLKEILLADWRSVLPRGDWRMIFPFSPAGQSTIAERLAAEVAAGMPAVVRALRYPALTLNHAVLLYAATSDDDAIAFRGYDPNDQDRPVTLVYDRAGRTFVYPARRYFAGGPIKVYEIYDGLLF